jgi:hypothetical protein
VDLNFGIATGAYVQERDDWDAAIQRAAREGWRYLELTALRRTRLDRLVDVAAATLARFDRVSLHAPTDVYTATDLVDQIHRLDFRGDVVLHPDVWNDDALAKLKSCAVFENMDVNKQYGRNVADLSEVFERFPEAGFCIDVAHVWTNDPSLALGHHLLDEFGQRLRQVHVSGIEADGTHRETTKADLELYGPLLTRCRSVPWLLEATLA